MKVTKTKIPGALIIHPKVHRDDRGFFFESFRADAYAKEGMPAFVQDNVSHSSRGVLRGLHFQNPNPQGKLVSVLEGEVFDVAVDMRLGSPTFGAWVSVRLQADLGRQFYVPPGCAHGFVVMSRFATFAYKCTDYWNAKGEGTLAWDDPDVGIHWPTKAPQLAPKDAAGIRLLDIPTDKLVSFNKDNPCSL